jgi:hypothetical protein
VSCAGSGATSHFFLVHMLGFHFLGFLVNSETGHSEDRQPNLRHALGSVKRVKVRATGDLRAHPHEVVGHRPALPAYPRLVTDTPPWQVAC